MGGTNNPGGGGVSLKRRSSSVGQVVGPRSESDRVADGGCTRHGHVNDTDNSDKNILANGEGVLGVGPQDDAVKRDLGKPAVQSIDVLGRVAIGSCGDKGVDLNDIPSGERPVGATGDVQLKAGPTKHKCRHLVLL